MTTNTSVNYTIQKVKKKSANMPWYGLEVTDFLIPFPYRQPSDLVVALMVVGEDDVLTTDKYIVDGSVLRLDEEALGLDKSDSLTVSLNIARNTQVDFAIYQPGHPIKADDLNDNFEQLFYKIEENTTLIQNNTVVSDTPPVNPYKGQHWLQLPYFREYIYTSSEWVQPQ